MESNARVREIQDLGSRCVHCGFCLPACPTYAVTRDENDSPRGRIWLLMQAAQDLTFDNAKLRSHLDRCIGCEACVPACPSGVRYDKMLPHARVLIEQARPYQERILSTGIITLLSDRRKVRASLLGRRAAPAMRQVLGLINDRSSQRATQLTHSLLSQLPTTSSAVLTYVPSQSHQDRVGLLKGCVASVFQPQVNEDAKAVLDAERISVWEPSTQGCCGALAMHTGEIDKARALAGRLMEQFPSDLCDEVLVTSAGCGAAMKRYHELFEPDTGQYQQAMAFSSRVSDVMVYLASREPRAPRGEVPMTAGYHDPCHLAYAQGVTAEPRKLLAAIPGLEIETVGGLSCCGSGGTFSVMHQELADQIVRYKVDAIGEMGTRVVISANPGCTLWMGQQLPDVDFVHPVTVLRWSLDNARTTQRSLTD